MIKEKDLESAYFQMGKNNLPSTILIKGMAVQRLNIKVVRVIGGELKDHKKEGYGSELWADGDKYMGQFM